MAGVYAAQEHCDEQVSYCETIEDLEALASELADQIREVAQEYQGSADNIESGFGHSTSVSEDLADKAEQLESWADDIEGVDFDEFEEEEDDEEEGDDDSEEEGDETAREEWLDEQRDKLIEIMNECPL
jgi:hypothetical protein